MYGLKLGSVATSNMIAEANAMLQGLVTCVGKPVHNMDTEAHSQILVQLINDKGKGPWSIAFELAKITQLLNGLYYLETTKVR